MAKAAAKTPTAPKKSAARSSAKANGGTINIEQVCEDALTKLKSLDIQHQLQSDIEWCLGSFRSDGNPVGLYAMAERALAVFQEEKARKTKGVTAKTVTDLEKAIQKRPA